MYLKTNRGKRIILTLIAFVVLIIIGIAIIKIKQSCRVFKCLSFEGKDSWRVIQVYEDTNNAWKGLIQASGYQVRLYKISNVDGAQAGEFTKVTVMSILGLFDTARSPYPGAISDKITCSDEFKPTQEDFKSSKGVDVHLLTSRLNDRLQYGSCLDNQTAFNVVGGIFYCENRKTWYQLELISSKDSGLDNNYLKNLFNNVGCN